MVCSSEMVGGLRLAAVSAAEWRWPAGFVLGLLAAGWLFPCANIRLPAAAPTPPPPVVEKEEVEEMEEASEFDEERRELEEPIEVR